MANLSNINNKFIVTDGGNGRVLIGATNDIGATLFANHPSTTAPSLTFNAPAGQVFENEDLQIAFGLNNASPYNGYMQTRFTSAPYYRNLAINPLGGNVGIGTNSPSGNLTVESAGNQFHIRASTATAGKFWNFDVTSANQLYIINSANTHYLTIKDTGNVGIGTPSPDTLLNIEGSSPILTIEDSRTSIGDGTIMGRIDFKQNDDSGSGTGVSGSIYSISESTTGQGSGLAFNTGVPGSTTEKMRIQSTTGNVGIGETSPDSKLHVKGDMVTIEDPSGGFKMELSADANPVTIMSDNLTGAAYGEMAFNAGNGSGANDQTRMHIDSAGNIRIPNKIAIGSSSSPNTKLDVNGTTGTRNRNTTTNETSSVFETSRYYGVPGSATTSISIDTTVAFPPMGSGGYILVEVSAAGYGSGGTNGLIFSYITGGYGGHYAALNAAYHPVTIITNTMQNGTCTWYNPNATTIGITITNGSSTSVTGVMRVKVTTTY